MAVYEWCPYCDTEVKLKALFKIQECPSCGRSIKPCALCDMDKVDCSKCKLDRSKRNVKIDKQRVN